MATQTFLPGQEPRINRKVHNRAIKYSQADDACKLAKEVRDTHREDLVAEMKRQKLTVYQFDGVSVELKESCGCKVKVSGEDNVEEPEE